MSRLIEWASQSTERTIIVSFFAGVVVTIFIELLLGIVPKIVRFLR